MSSTGNTSNKVSRVTKTSLNNIRPVLQSKKKPDTKSLETSFITPVPKEPKKSSPVRKIEAKKKDSSSATSDSSIIGYKIQRELRHRNSDQAKTERGMLKEIEKIQENVRKNPSFKELKEEIEERKCYSSNRTPNARVGLETHNEENKYQGFGSVKEMICRRLLEKNGFKSHKNIEFQQEISFFDEPQVKIETDSASIFEIHEENVSLERSAELMPQLEFFQYNYGSFRGSSDSDMNIQPYKEPVLEYCEPYPDTISIIHELDLSRNLSKLITTITNKYQPLFLPIIELPCFFSKTRVTINKIAVSDDDSWNIRKKTTVLLRKNQYFIQQKPCVGIYTKELPVEVIEILVLEIEDYHGLIKPQVDILNCREYQISKKSLDFYMLETSSASVISKPSIDIYQDFTPVKQIEVVSSKDLQKIQARHFIFENSPVAKDLPISSNKKVPIDCNLTQSSNEDFLGIDHLESTTSNQPVNFSDRLKSPTFHSEPSFLPEFLPIDTLPEDPKQSTPITTTPIPLLLINNQTSVQTIQDFLRRSLAIKHIKEIKVKLARTKRMKESALYILCNICNRNLVFCYFSSWKALLIESEDLYPRFVDYCAKLIQRNWRGYYTRMYILPQIYKIKKFCRNLKAVIIGWKTRKILSTKRMQNHKKNIRDLNLMISELSIDSDSTSKQLLATMVDQLPNMRSKFIKDFNSLYRTGTWVALLVTRVPRKSWENTKKPSSTHGDSDAPMEYVENPRFVQGRDEIPIRPLQVSYEHIASEIVEEMEVKPKRVFTNFLKRKTRKGRENEEKVGNELEGIKERGEEREAEKERIYDNQEETMQEERRYDGKPKEFLKRKSQTIKPKKVQWKVEKKIDCWVSKDIYLKKNQKLVTDIEKDKEALDIEELENIFQEVLSKYIDTSAYLKKFERVTLKTKIPQFKSCSDILLMHNEETYYEMLEKLEEHYLQLCSEGLKL